MDPHSGGLHLSVGTWGVGSGPTFWIDIQVLSGLNLLDVLHSACLWSGKASDSGHETQNDKIRFVFSLSRVPARSRVFSWANRGQVWSNDTGLDPRYSAPQPQAPRPAVRPPGRGPLWSLNSEDNSCHFLLEVLFVSLSLVSAHLRPNSAKNLKTTLCSVGSTAP